MPSSSTATDLEALIRVVARFRREDMDRLSSKIKVIPNSEYAMDRLLSLHSTTHGVYSIGREGHRLIGKIVEREWPEKFRKRHRVAKDTLVRGFMDAFVDLVLDPLIEKKFPKEVDETKLISQLRSHVESARLRPLRTRRNIVTISLPEDPRASPFKIGPIRFLPKSEARQALLESALRESDHFIDGFNFLNDQPWLAEITHKANDDEFSNETAAWLLKCGLAVVKIVSFRPETLETRLMVRSRLWRTEPISAVLHRIGRKWGHNVHYSFGGRHDEGWTALIRAKNARMFISRVGELLALEAKLFEIGDYNRRVLSALAWFDDATCEDFDASKLLKACNAIESISVLDPDKRTAQFTNNGAKLAALFDRSQDWSRKLARVYQVRSSLVHGRMTPIGDTVRESAGAAVFAARASIVGAFSLSSRSRPDFAFSVDQAKTLFEKTRLPAIGPS